MFHVCFPRSKLKYIGEPRTFGSLKRQLEAWTLSGDTVASAKYFGNVIKSSLVPADDNELVIDKIPPPELHLLLGVVNTMYSG